jgi:hypothetical protein
VVGVVRGLTGFDWVGPDGANHERRERHEKEGEMNCIGILVEEVLASSFPVKGG